MPLYKKIIEPAHIGHVQLTGHALREELPDISNNTLYHALLQLQSLVGHASDVFSSLAAEMAAVAHRTERLSSRAEAVKTTVNGLNWSSYVPGANRLYADALAIAQEKPVKDEGDTDEDKARTTNDNGIHTPVHLFTPAGREPAIEAQCAQCDNGALPVLRQMCASADPKLFSVNHCLLTYSPRPYLPSPPALPADVNVSSTSLHSGADLSNKASPPPPPVRDKTKAAAQRKSLDEFLTRHANDTRSLSVTIPPSWTITGRSSSSPPTSRTCKRPTSSRPLSRSAVTAANISDHSTSILVDVSDAKRRRSRLTAMQCLAPQRSYADLSRCSVGNPAATSVNGSCLFSPSITDAVSVPSLCGSTALDVADTRTLNSCRSEARNSCYGAPSSSTTSSSLALRRRLSIQSHNMLPDRKSLPNSTNRQPPPPSLKIGASPLHLPYTPQQPTLEYFNRGALMTSPRPIKALHIKSTAVAAGPFKKPSFVRTRSRRLKQRVVRLFSHKGTNSNAEQNGHSSKSPTSPQPLQRSSAFGSRLSRASMILRGRRPVSESAGAAGGGVKRSFTACDIIPETEKASARAQSTVSALDEWLLSAAEFNSSSQDKSSTSSSRMSSSMSCHAGFLPRQRRDASLNRRHTAEPGSTGASTVVKNGEDGEVWVRLRRSVAGGGTVVGSAGVTADSTGNDSSSSSSTSGVVTSGPSSSSATDPVSCVGRVPGSSRMQTSIERQSSSGFWSSSSLSRRESMLSDGHGFERSPDGADRTLVSNGEQTNEPADNSTVRFSDRIDWNELQWISLRRSCCGRDGPNTDSGHGDLLRPTRSASPPRAAPLPTSPDRASLHSIDADGFITSMRADCFLQPYDDGRDAVTKIDSLIEQFAKLKSNTELCSTENGTLRETSFCVASSSSTGALLESNIDETERSATLPRHVDSKLTSHRFGCSHSADNILSSTSCQCTDTSTVFCTLPRGPRKFSSSPESLSPPIPQLPPSMKRLSTSYLRNTTSNASETTKYSISNMWFEPEASGSSTLRRNMKRSTGPIGNTNGLVESDSNNNSQHPMATVSSPVKSEGQPTALELTTPPKRSASFDTSMLSSSASRDCRKFATPTGGAVKHKLRDGRLRPPLLCAIEEQHLQSSSLESLQEVDNVLKNIQEIIHRGATAV